MGVERLVEKALGDGIAAALDAASVSAGVYGVWGAYPPDTGSDAASVGLAVGGRSYESSGTTWFSLPVAITVDVPVALDESGDLFASSFDAVMSVMKSLQSSIASVSAAVSPYIPCSFSSSTGTPTVGDVRHIDISATINLAE